MHHLHSQCQCQYQANGHALISKTISAYGHSGRQIEIIYSRIKIHTRAVRSNAVQIRLVRLADVCRCRTWHKHIKRDNHLELEFISDFFSAVALLLSAFL